MLIKLTNITLSPYFDGIPGIFYTRNVNYGQVNQAFGINIANFETLAPTITESEIVPIIEKCYIKLSDLEILIMSKIDRSLVR